MVPQPSRPVRRSFGPFEYEASTGELRKFGNRIRLQGQPIQILELLLDRGGEVVTREELQRLLWKDTPFVDSEHGLNAAVNKLRQALGDSADQPRYIETLPGRGYRFVGPLVQDRSLIEMAPVAAVRPAAASSPHWAWLALAGLLLAAIGFWAGTRRTEPAVATQATRFTIAPPAGFVFEQGPGRPWLALSPDGTKLAFIGRGAKGGAKAFIRDLATLESKPVPGVNNAYSLFWQGDGRALFVGENGKLRRYRLDGAEPTLVGDLPPFSTGGVALDDGRVLVSSWAASLLLGPPGSATQRLAGVHSWPQHLPGGRLLTMVRPGRPGEWKTRTVNAATLTDERTPFETGFAAQYAASPRGTYLMYVRAGTLMAQPFDAARESLSTDTLVVAHPVAGFQPSGGADFSASLNGTVAYSPYVERSKLAWVDRTGRVVGQLQAGNVNVLSGRISPDGTKVAAALSDVERAAQDLWIFDVATGAGRKLSAEPSLRDAAVWSPDSRSVAYLRQHTGFPQVGFRGLEIADAEELLPPGRFQLPSDWSRDGRYVLYQTTGIPQVASEVQSDVWLADRRDKSNRPLIDSAFHEANGMFSPDGHWVAFTSNESGQAEVYLQAFAEGRVTGPRHHVAKSGALAIRWRRDGRELYYMQPDGRIFAVPVTMGARPEFGAALPLFGISAEARWAFHSVIGFDVTEDGTRFLIPVVDTEKEGPLIVVARDWDAPKTP